MKELAMIVTTVDLAEVASRDEVSKFTGISKPTLARWAMEGKGPKFRRAGGRVLYLRQDVMAWLDALETGGSPGLTAGTSAANVAACTQEKTPGTVAAVPRD